MFPSHSSIGTGQRGSAMIVALIFLLLMTLVSTASMRSSTMQERMSGNVRDMNLAFQAAEAALREAERMLQLNTEILPDFNNQGGYYIINAASRPRWVGATTSDGNGFLLADPVPGTAARPQYFIEELPFTMGGDLSGDPVDADRYFRITARGFGAAPDTVAVLSSVYRSR